MGEFDDEPGGYALVVKLLTWNLWWRFGPDWKRRQADIAAEISRVGADVCAFQEVFCVDGDDQMDMLTQATGFDGVATEHKGKRVQFGNALLSRYPLTKVEQLRLPGPDGEPSHRSAIVADLDAPNGPVSIAVTHLEWRYDASAHRRRQLVPIVTALSERRDRGRTPMLLGDLNAIAESDELRQLTGHAPLLETGVAPLLFTDSWAAVGDGPGHTWVRENSNAVDAAFPRRRLDHVMIGWPRPKPSFNPRSAELVGVSANAEGIHPSDHYGVLVTVDDREPFGDPA